MKFELKGPFKENIYVLMRKIGYHYQGQIKDEFSFIRPARDYPRFHLFIKPRGENLLFSLHLNQKAPIYKGARAHASEYDTEIVLNEAERIKKVLQK